MGKANPIRVVERGGSPEAAGQLFGSVEAERECFHPVAERARAVGMSGEGSYLFPQGEEFVRNVFAGIAGGAGYHVQVRVIHGNLFALDGSGPWLVR